MKLKVFFKSRKFSVLVIIYLSLCVGIVNVPLQAATDCTAQTQIPLAECEALLDFYHKADGKNWKENRGWNKTNEPCEWIGVGCACPSAKNKQKSVLTRTGIEKMQPPALASIPNPSSPSPAEIEEIRQPALASIPNPSSPSPAEIEEIRQRALASIPNPSGPSPAEIEEIRQRALASIPSQVEIEEMRQRGLASVPSQTEIEEIRQRRLASVPSQVEIEEMQQRGLTSAPSQTEIEEMQRHALAKPACSQTKQHVTSLLLPQIQFSGKVPSSFSNLKRLKMLILGNSYSFSGK
jgi:DNA-binding TFAR19-related protein (PDSD5 family)